MKAKYYSNRLSQTVISLLMLGFIILSASGQSIMDDTKREWGKTINGMKLSIMTTNKEVFSIGEPIIIDISLKNVGTNEIPLAMPPLGLDLNLNVMLPNKAAAPLTAYGKTIIGNAGMTVETIMLKPGTSIPSYVAPSLDKMFQLNQTGTFTVSAEWTVKSHGHSVEVVSNEIKITIIK
jgi:hypothetical protein